MGTNIRVWIACLMLCVTSASDSRAAALQMHNLGDNVKPNLVWLTDAGELYLDPQQVNPINTCVSVVVELSSGDQVVEDRICFSPNEFIVEVTLLSSTLSEVEIHLERSTLSRVSRD